MANPAMTLISSQTLGGTTASVTFSSIPSTYNDLKLLVSARGSTATVNQFINIAFNGDSATNYSYTLLNGVGTTSASTRVSSSTFDAGVSFDAASATASTFGSAEIYIPNYNATASKPWFDLSMVENNSSSLNVVSANSHLYRGASGISSITLTPNNGNFVQYSTFTLYGIANS